MGQQISEFLVHYFVPNAERIFYWTFFGGVLSATVWVVYSQFSSKGSAGSAPNTASVDLARIEDTIKELLSKANTLTTVAPPGVSTTSGAPVDPGVLEALKTSLKQKETEIATLKASVTAPAGPDPAEVSKLQEKVKDLEGRLAEYEIIEDDIADLSRFKDENTKLKEELRMLKGGDVPAAPAPSEDLVSEFASALEKQKEPKIETAPVTAEAVAPAPAPVPEPAPVATAAAPAPVASSMEGDDILAEFAKDTDLSQLASEAVADFANTPAPAAAPSAPAPAAPAAPKTAVPAAPPSDDSDIDTDKMLTEMDSLAQAASIVGGNSLEEELDVDKMASEAQRLTSNE